MRFVYLLLLVPSLALAQFDALPRIRDHTVDLPNRGVVRFTGSGVQCADGVVDGVATTICTFLDAAVATATNTPTRTNTPTATPTATNTSTPTNTVNVSLVFAGPAFQVNTYTINYQVASIARSIEAGVGTGFVVTWRSGDGQDGNLDGVFAQRYTSAGAVAGSEFQVNTYTIGNQGNRTSSRAIDVGVADDGDFTIAWHGLESADTDYGIWAQRFTSAGAFQGSEFLVNTTTVGLQRRPAIAYLTNKDFVILWDHCLGSSCSSLNYKIMAQRYASSGAAVGAEFQVNGDTNTYANSGRIVSDGSANFLVVWQQVDNDGVGMKARRVNTVGAVQGTEFQVNTITVGNQTDGNETFDGTNWWVTWSSAGTTIKAQRIATDSSFTGSEIAVTAGVGDSQPDVSRGDSDQVVFSFMRQGPANGDIWAKQYTTGGSAVASEFQVNTATVAIQQRPSVAGSRGSDHRYIIVWQDDDNHQTGIEARGLIP